jgi:hypothetical protein
VTRITPAPTARERSKRSGVQVKRQLRRDAMPIILWLLGVPLSVVLLLWIFNIV